MQTLLKRGKHPGHNALSGSVCFSFFFFHINDFLLQHLCICLNAWLFEVFFTDNLFVLVVVSFK